MFIDKLKLSIAAIVTTVMLAGAPVLAVPDNNNGDNNPHDKVTICHATSSQSNPYVTESPNANGDVSGHDGHSKDIIPPFDYNDNGTTKHYAGKNWDAQGQAIFNNDCKAGGQGGGGSQTTTTQVTTTQNQVTGGQGAVAGQAANVPKGGVAAGEGGAKVTSAGAALGLVGSIGTVASGLALAARKL